MSLGQSIAAGACTRETHVKSEACKLREALSLLNDRLVELGDKIEPVLRNEPECEGKGVLPPQEYLVPLASDYRANREQVERMIARVGSYLNRLEL